MRLRGASHACILFVFNIGATHDADRLINWIQIGRPNSFCDIQYGIGILFQIIWLEYWNENFKKLVQIMKHKCCGLIL